MVCITCIQVESVLLSSKMNICYLLCRKRVSFLGKWKEDVLPLDIGRVPGFREIPAKFSGNLEIFGLNSMSFVSTLTRRFLRYFWQRSDICAILFQSDILENVEIFWVFNFLAKIPSSSHSNGPTFSSFLVRSFVRCARKNKYFRFSYFLGFAF